MPLDLKSHCPCPCERTERGFGRAINTPVGNPLLATMDALRMIDAPSGITGSALCTAMLDELVRAKQHKHRAADERLEADGARRRARQKLQPLKGTDGETPTKRSTRPFD